MTTKTKTYRFAAHYAEMVAAMIIGMIVLGLPVEGALRAIGSSWSQLGDDAPALMLAAMCFTMTVPMVAWMRYRGHSWRPCAEMAASMIVPTIAVVALLATGAVEGIGALLTLEHGAMLPAMLMVMLLRVDEYAGCHHEAPEVATA